MCRVFGTTRLTNYGKTFEVQSARSSSDERRRRLEAHRGPLMDLLAIRKDETACKRETRARMSASDSEDNVEIRERTNRSGCRCR